MHVRTNLVCVSGVFAVRFVAILGHFKYYILRCGLIKTITALHLNFVVTCEVRYGLVYKVRSG